MSLKSVSFLPFPDLTGSTSTLGDVSCSLKCLALYASIGSNRNCVIALIIELERVGVCIDSLDLNVSFRWKYSAIESNGESFSD